jgi:hypothetical protein
MKKVMSLLVMVIFATSISVAQNNLSEVSQTGQNNSATTEQVGDNNVSDVRQERVSGLPLTVSGLNDNEYDLYQEGSGNISKLGQNYGTSEAKINQIGDNNKLRNSKTFTNSNYLYGESEFAIQGASILELDQNGDRNEAGVNQRAKDNFADIDQTGNDNKTDVYQYSFGGVAPPAFGNEAIIEQIGNENISEVSQSGALGSSGRSNEVLVKQEGNNNNTKIYQFGNENTAKHWVYGYNNIMDIDQTGDKHAAVIDQYNYKDVDNYGNNVSVIQEGPHKNDFYAKLKGDDNIINIHQNGAWNGIRGLNAGLTGYGNLNEAFIYEGDNSKIDIKQEHNANRVYAEIRNSNGDIDVYQYSRNSAEIDVKGPNGGLLSGNSVDISQINPNRNGNPFSLEKNWVDVTQRSNNNAASASQNGWNNSASIFQK